MKVQLAKSSVNIQVNNRKKMKTAQAKE